MPTAGIRVFGVLVAVLAAAPALAQTQQQKDWCYKDAFTDEQTLSGCTAVIQGGKTVGADLGAAYANRCLAYNHR